MRKRTPFLVILLVICIGGLLGRRIIISQSRQISYRNSTTPTPLVGIPVEMRIPKLHMDAQIESVGLDSHQRMDVPKKVNDVAWYNLGSKPGEKGSAVID